MKNLTYRYNGIIFYLSYLPPIKTVKEIVCPSLISVGLESGLHAWCSCNPHPLLLMVPPVSVKALTEKKFSTFPFGIEYLIEMCVGS